VIVAVPEAPPRVDLLTHLLQRFPLQAGVFYAGGMCGVHDFERDTGRGHLHLVRRGPVRLVVLGSAPIDIVQPALVLLPRPEAHQLIADDRDGADVVCGTVLFGAAGRNPVADALPDLVQVPLAELPGSDALLHLLLDEAFVDRCGRQGAVDRLCEVLLLRLLRHGMAQGWAVSGALAGLEDARLAPALQALHERPAHPWTLEQMALLAALSRSRFARRFHAVMGQAPMDYLTGYRLALAQGLLRQGRAPKAVAQAAGYASTAAFGRAFLRRVGLTPSAWLATPVAVSTLGPPDDTRDQPA
jgi:AraC-like DNA-binding protein